MQWSDSMWYMRDIISPVLDISILTFLCYKVFIQVSQTRAVEMVRAVVLLGVLFALARLLQLPTLLWLYNHGAVVVILTIAVIYQPELRRAFTRMGGRSSRLFRLSNRTSNEQIETVVNAMQVLAAKGRGALAVFPRRLSVRGIINSGTRINGEITGALLLTIFDHDTPLHDGAVIIHEGKIQSAGSFLPISEQADIRKSFGSRHRAALGMAEETDAVMLVVSEETGSMSLAYNANLYYDLSPETIRRTLIALLNYQEILPDEVEEAADEVR